MIAEANGSGAVQKEYIWLDDMPVAMVDSTGASPVLYFIHTDQLGTPQKLTDGSMSVVWDGVFDPFGNPASGASLGLTNVRFPRQYFDGESGLNQNWNRDYDPTTGRYIQSDPIGLGGGANTYSYTGGNPFGFADLMGLWRDPNSQFCVSLKRRIENQRKDLEKRYKEYDEDPLGLPERIGPGEPLSATRRGHRTLINIVDSQLRKNERQYDDECRGPPPPPAPSCPFQKAAPSPTDAEKKAAGVGFAAGVIIYWAISEGTRVFPLRNLIPIL